jgi:hypothetical protein
MQNIVTVKLSVIHCYAECHYTECNYSECHGTDAFTVPNTYCMSFVLHIKNVIIAQFSWSPFGGQSYQKIYIN